jgi:hypothetical protein
VDTVCDGNTVDGRTLSGTPVCETGILISSDADGGINVSVSDNIVKHGISASQGIYFTGTVDCRASGNTVGGFFTDIVANGTSGLVIHDNMLLAPVAAGGGHIAINNVGTNQHNVASRVTGNRFSGACQQVIATFTDSGRIIRDLVITDNSTVDVVSTFPALQLGPVQNLLCERNHSDHLDDPAKSLNQAVWTVAGTYTMREADSLVLLSDAAFTVTLRCGRVVTFKKQGGSVNIVTIDCNGAETIDAAATYTLQTIHKYVTIRSDGANWRIVANN